MMLYHIRKVRSFPCPHPAQYHPHLPVPSPLLHGGCVDYGDVLAQPTVETGDVLAQPQVGTDETDPQPEPVVMNSPTRPRRARKPNVI